MSLFCSLVFTLSSVQFTPSDVPKNHWAYSAVNELFQNRLLDGYPSETALRLDRKLVYDEKAVMKDMTRWKQNGLLVGYPDGLHRRPPSRYEYAVAVHAVYSNIRELAAKSHESPQAESQFTMNVVPELREITRVISMLNWELDKLGADTHQMVLDLNGFWPMFKPAFRG